MRVIGVDIGGSGVRAAQVDADGTITDVVRVPLLEDRGVGPVCAAVRSAIGDRRPDRVGIGVPGFVRGGTVIASPNFPTWDHVDLRARLFEGLGVPVAIDNDANAATWGAWRTLPGLSGDLVLLTLGTGVGGGVVSEGRLIRGVRGTAAELGHLFVGGDAPCGCGGVGCLEAWCSSTGWLRQATRGGHPAVDGRGVIDAARSGHEWALTIVSAGAQALGVGLVTLANLFAPATIVIAGGLSEARDLLAPRAEDLLRRRGIPANTEALDLRWIGSADRLAMVGAAEAARDL